MLSASFCLVQSKANDFLKAVQKGEIDPFKMMDMSSKERHDLLSKYVGEENATQVNSLYESKLLLKNQEQGLINWIKKTGNLNLTVKRDLLSRVQKMDRVLNPQENEQFKKDLASTKLGTDVTQEEAKQVFNLSKKVEETSSAMQKDFTFKSESERLAYGKARVDLANYVNELKGNDKFNIKSVTDVAGLSKSIRASLDDSAIFRQGWKTLFTNPTTWAKNAASSFADIAKEIGGKNVLDQVMTDRESRPNELNGNYKKMGLAVSKAEEAYPVTLPEKIPLFGRLYKASETAYTGFLYRMRMDIADKYLQIAKDQNVELTPKELKSIGSMVNSLTGRGNLGKYEPAANAVNSIFFSPRNVKSQFDTLGHVITGAGGSNFVRKQAAVNLVKVVGGIAAIMTIANAVRPGSAETDPRSSDFGKIKIGDTRFDISGGMGSLVTLASRLATMSSKSSTTGNVTPLNAVDKKGNPAYGAKTGKDVVVDYLANKLSPAASVVKDLLTQHDFQGKPITIGGEVKNLVEPLSIANFEELKNDPNSANMVLALIADGLGIATNTYAQAAPKTPKTSSAKTPSLNRTVRETATEANLSATMNKLGAELIQYPNSDKYPPSVRGKQVWEIPTKGHVEGVNFQSPTIKKK